MPSRKRKGRGRKLTLRKGAATASKLKGKLKTAAKKQIEEENSQNSGNISRIMLRIRSARTQKILRLPIFYVRPTRACYFISRMGNSFA